jgi:hypothetical protein
LLRYVVSDPVSPEVDEGQVTNGIDAEDKGNDCNDTDNGMSLHRVQHGLVSLVMPEQMQNKDDQDYVFSKRFPGRQLYSVAEAAAIRNLVEVS